jgi:hypothetical protein
VVFRGSRVVSIAALLVGEQTMTQRAGGRAKR